MAENRFHIAFKRSASGIPTMNHVSETVSAIFMSPALCYASKSMGVGVTLLKI
jgi:hypothetical protein